MNIRRLLETSGWVPGWLVRAYHRMRGVHWMNYEVNRQITATGREVSSISSTVARDRDTIQRPLPSELYRDVVVQSEASRSESSASVSTRNLVLDFADIERRLIARLGISAEDIDASLRNLRTFGTTVSIERPTETGREFFTTQSKPRPQPAPHPDTGKAVDPPRKIKRTLVGLQVEYVRGKDGSIKSATQFKREVETDFTGKEQSNETYNFGEAKTLQPSTGRRRRYGAGP